MLTKLKTLNICDNHHITDRGISTLTNLTSLEMYTDNNITDNGISLLTNLTHISFVPYAITDQGISNLINLTYIDLGSHPRVTFDGLSNLSKLRSIIIEEQEIIMDKNTIKVMEILCNLRAMKLMNNSKIFGLSKLIFGKDD